jgi:uncharacterized cupin superfamily protein
MSKENAKGWDSSKPMIAHYDKYPKVKLFKNVFRDSTEAPGLFVAAGPAPGSAVAKGFEKTAIQLEITVPAQETMMDFHGGIYTMKPGEFDWEFTYGCLEIVLEGDFGFRDRETGEVVIAEKGDAVWATRGSKVVEISKKGCKVFWMTNPPWNWMLGDRGVGYGKK